MALDSNLQLYDTSFNGAPNTDVNGNWVNLGRRGLPQGSQFIVGVDNPGGTSGDNPVVTLKLEATLDNGTTVRPIASFAFDPSSGHQGQVAIGCDFDFNPQEYASANVDVRLTISPVSDNTSNNVTADKIYAFLGQGEKTMWGRAATADTLYT